MPIRWTRFGPILRLGLPIVFALLAQNIMLLTTTAMVGRLGDVALAGVGVGTALLSMAMAILFGVDTGVQVVVARRWGAGDLQGAGAGLGDALALSLLVGLALAFVAFWLGPIGAERMVKDPAVIAAARLYLFAASPALLFLGACFAFTAYWNGSSASMMSFVVVFIQLPINVLLNYVLIFGKAGILPLGVAGAGLAMTLSTAAALAVHVALLRIWTPARCSTLQWPDLAGIRTIIRIGLPVSMQQFLVYLGAALFIAIAGQLGTRQVAAVNVLSGILLLSILLATGMGIASATLVSQALGRNDVSDAKAFGWQVGWIGVLIVLPLSLTVLAYPMTTLRIFIVDEETVGLAVTPLQLLALAMGIEALGRVLAFSLRGAGATLLAAIVSFLMQWLLQLPLCWFVGVLLGYGLVGMYGVRLLLYVAETVVMAFIWHRGDWARIQIGGERSGGGGAALSISKDPKSA